MNGLDIPSTPTHSRFSLSDTVYKASESRAEVSDGSTYTVIPRGSRFVQGELFLEYV